MSEPLEPGGTWTCECSKAHTLPAYVSAHWEVNLTHTCPCGRRHNIKAGVITLVQTKTKGQRPATPKPIQPFPGKCQLADDLPGSY
jgi:hypothetical protein